MIFVTGASGFVGRHFVLQLAKSGHNARGLKRAGKVAPVEHKKLEWRDGDITRREDMEACLTGVDTIVHLAALLSSPDEAANQTVNAESTRTLIQLCRVHGIERFVLMSAAAATFKETNAYGRSKRKAEEILAASGLDYTILRAPLIVGRGSEEWGRFVDYLREVPGVVPVFGDGRAIKCPVYIDDVVDALSSIVAQPELGQRVWEVACPERISLDQLINLTLGQLGLKKFKLHIPLGISLLLAGMAEKILGHRSPLTRDIVVGLNQDVLFDGETARIGLSIKPRSVHEAVANDELIAHSNRP